MGIFSSINFSQAFATLLLNKGADAIIKNWQRFEMPFKERYFGNERIRFAISYLFRISVKDQNGHTKYLLVKNSRVDMFQPPGGVYKHKDKKVLEKFKAEDHLTFHKKNDLRITIPKKNVRRLLKKFNDSSWREVGFNREFKEELLDTNILPLDLFACPAFRPIERRSSGVVFSTHFQCNEIKFFDIVEVELNASQQNFLEKLLLKSPSEDFLFATKDMIIREGCSIEQNRDLIRIAPHTKRIFKSNKL